MRTAQLLLATLVVAAASTSRAGEIPFDTLKSRWAHAVRDFGVPGMSVAVVTSDSILFEHSFGSRNLERTRSANTDTRYYIASSTKSFTALAILQLVDQGVLSLDDPLITHLPSFALAEPIESSPVRIRDLLTHASGLTNEIPVSLHESYTGHTISDEFFYSTVATYVGQSGSFKYGNLHYSLLGRVIESVTSQPWQEYVIKNILVPAKMTRTTPYASVAQADDNHAEMIYRQGPGHWRRPDITKVDSSMSPAGGIYASVHDLARWIQLQLNDGTLETTRFLSRDLVQASRSPQVQVDTSFSGFTREHYGYGWYVGSYLDETLVHCFGSFASGARAHLSYMPNHDIGVAVVTNVAHGPGMQMTDAIAKDIYDSLLDHIPDGDHIEALRHRLDEAHPSELSGLPLPNMSNNPVTSENSITLDPVAYTGTFHSDVYGTITVFLEDGLLVIGYGGIHHARLTSFRNPDTFIVFLEPRSIASVGQFLVEDNAVRRVALDLPGTPDGVAIFTRIAE
ncbi:MAG: serine hydrolase domain-containing protein [Phycisphaerales bacterium JB043]